MFAGTGETQMTQTIAERDAADRKNTLSPVESLIIETYRAASSLRKIADWQIQKTLLSLADAVQENTNELLKANEADVIKQDPNDPKVDRLRLTEQRIT